MKDEEVFGGIKELNRIEKKWFVVSTDSWLPICYLADWKIYGSGETKEIALFDARLRIDPTDSVRNEKTERLIQNVRAVKMTDLKRYLNKNYELQAILFDENKDTMDLAGNGVADETAELEDQFPKSWGENERE